MKRNEESKIIIESINKTIDEFKENSESCRGEEDLLLRLYQNLCEKLGTNSFKRISGKYSPYKTKEQKEKNKEYSKSYRTNPRYLKDIIRTKKVYLLYEPKKKNKDIFDAIIKAGTYDLVIFDENENKINHIIEIKKLTDVQVHPEMADRHKALEDIFELTDFIKKGYKNRSDELDIECRAYNLIFVTFSKTRNEDDYKKIKQYLDDISVAYENAGIAYISIGFDKKLIENAKAVKLKDIIGGSLKQTKTTDDS